MATEPRRARSGHAGSGIAIASSLVLLATQTLTVAAEKRDSNDTAMRFGFERPAGRY